MLVYCPGCKQNMKGEIPVKGSPKASSYSTCLRKCELCGIAASNAMTGGTFIYRNPLDNIPLEARQHAMLTLSGSLNRVNIQSKKTKFGFSTSEDAVTWTVFSFLEHQRHLATMTRVLNLLPTPPVSEPTLILWGSPIPDSNSEGKLIRKNIENILRTIGENPTRYSEPDVVLDYGAQGLVFIEVKFRSANSVETDTTKFDRYLDGSDAFVDREGIKQSGLYELARNWRIANSLADGRPVILVNLVNKLDDGQRIRTFYRGLKIDRMHSFRQVLWQDLLLSLPTLPAWLVAFAMDRALMPKPRKTPSDEASLLAD